MTQREAIAKAPSGRVTRNPIGRRNVLTVQGKEPGYHYRVVNDTKDRVQQFLDDGWEIVPQKDVKIGDKRVEKTSSEGSASQLSVGNGQKAYVLRLKQDWYDEDQLAKQKQVAAIEAQTRQKALDGNYGKLDLTRD